MEFSYLCPMIIEKIAHIETDFDTKFGVPRQAGLVPGQLGRIVMEPPFRVPDAFRGLEGFSHVWLLWDFSECHREDVKTSGNTGDAAATDWRPTVRPPRLGGNRRMGVFATRSPFRPNNIGLSSVRLVRLELDTPDGPVLWVEGADLMNGTPIYDIKPYLPFTDAHPDATGGFTAETAVQEPLKVIIPPDLSEALIKASGQQKLDSLIAVLSADPRPHYQDDPTRLYGMSFSGHEIKFQVDGKTLTVIAIDE